MRVCSVARGSHVGYKLNLLGWVHTCNVTAYRNTVSWHCGRNSWPRNVSKFGYAVTLRACSVCCRYLAVASKGWYCYGLSGCGRATWRFFKGKNTRRQAASLLGLLDSWRQYRQVVPKRRQVIATVRCVTSQKSADLYLTNYVIGTNTCLLSEFSLFDLPQVCTEDCKWRALWRAAQTAGRRSLLLKCQEVPPSRLSALLFPTVRTLRPLRRFAPTAKCSVALRADLLFRISFKAGSNVSSADVHLCSAVQYAAWHCRDLHRIRSYCTDFRGGLLIRISPKRTKKCGKCWLKFYLRPSVKDRYLWININEIRSLRKPPLYWKLSVAHVLAVISVWHLTTERFTPIHFVSTTMPTLCHCDLFSPQRATFGQFDRCIPAESSTKWVTRCKTQPT